MKTSAFAISAALAAACAFAGGPDEFKLKVTGVAVAVGGRICSGVETTAVTFRPLSEEEIAAYVATGEPMDKAGAYGIQAGAVRFVQKVDGELDNVIGLPRKLLAKLLRDAGYEPGKETP